ncbi:iron-sulfur cluster carrier protein ApbC [Psychromonas sp. psych-6C06]|uniref:iron-sulfur cluster carrier protein ApbC n=1 Tax=Psychromonas sp. psych-6C06 TaxID=2058089 RepID=UPI000C32D35F|nr:iron-sulfur cluster carrier protein ApbC [Psychromonas sp. psych-6C06]PKF62548.1 iron-sulfur cluster carrier protein ApbC [Psychromonas sp. psych-6C06]
MLFKKTSTVDKIIAQLSDADNDALLKKLQQDKRISFDEKSVTLTVNLPFYAPSWLAQLQQKNSDKITALLAQPLNWVINYDIVALQSAGSKTALANIKNIIVVASGKGGVGKSTVSVNLALALSKNGAKVGMLDADIYGPSLPTLLGVKDAQPSTADGKLMLPIEAHGIVCNSIGFLVAEADAMIWRGPMASKALQQVLNETAWPALDYLVVDMPPGTGDIQLTMSQHVPISSAVIVTTPQDVALIDAKKGVTMFNKVDTHISGIIENMSLFTCSACGHSEAIFGTGGGEQLAAQFSLPFLGKLPLHINYRQDSDQGVPTVSKCEQNTLVEPYLALAETLAINLYKDLQPASQQINITELK